MKKVYIILTVFFGLLVFILLLRSRSPVKKVSPFKKILNKINTQSWESYTLQKKQNIYSLSTPTHKEILKASVGTEEKKNTITIHQGKTLKMKMEELSAHSGSYKGHFEQRAVQIWYQNQKQRIVIDFVNEEYLLEALGTYEGLPHPWYYGFPLLFLKQKKPIALLETPKHSIDDKTEDLTLELKVKPEEKKNIALFFFCYVLFMKLLPEKKIILDS